MDKNLHGSHYFYCFTTKNRSNLKNKRITTAVFNALQQNIANCFSF